MNQSFENFHIKRIEKSINILNRFLTININSSQKAVANTINECSNIIADNTIYELFDQFKYGDSNYILFV